MTHVGEQLHQGTPHLPLLGPNLRRFPRGQKPAIKVDDAPAGGPISGALPTVQIVSKQRQGRSLQPQRPPLQLGPQPLLEGRFILQGSSLNQHLQSLGITEGTHRQGRTHQLQ